MKIWARINHVGWVHLWLRREDFEKAEPSAHFFNGRAGCHADIGAHFISDDMGQGGFSQTRRAYEHRIWETNLVLEAGVESHLNLLPHMIVADQVA